MRYRPFFRHGSVSPLFADAMDDVPVCAPHIVPWPPCKARIISFSCAHFRGSPPALGRLGHCFLLWVFKHNWLFLIWHEAFIDFLANRSEFALAAPTLSQGAVYACLPTVGHVPPCIDAVVPFQRHGSVAIFPSFRRTSFPFPYGFSGCRPLYMDGYISLLRGFSCGPKGFYPSFSCTLPK